MIASLLYRSWIPHFGLFSLLRTSVQINEMSIGRIFEWMNDYRKILHANLEFTNIVSIDFRDWILRDCFFHIVRFIFNTCAEFRNFSVGRLFCCSLLFCWLFRMAADCCMLFDYRLWCDDVFRLCGDCRWII